MFAAGADKISINSAALADPTLITRIAERFGSQAVVVAIDAKRQRRRFALGGLHTWRANGDTGSDAVEWAQEAESRGAGEILLTSMDRDGTGAGFDCELTRAVADAVRIPVIASGGAGGAQTFCGSVSRRTRGCCAGCVDFSLRLEFVSAISSSNSARKEFR